MAHVILHCYYTGEEAAVRGFVEEMISSGLRREVLEEDGCVQYDYFFPALPQPCVLLMERWRDEQALAQHMNGAVMVKIRAVKAKYGIDTRLERCMPKD